MTAETIAKALNGRKAGSGWSARCPAHDDHTPSLPLRDSGDGKVLVRCHAGCDQDEVIAHLKPNGLWTQNAPRLFRYAASGRVTKPAEPDRDALTDAGAIATNIKHGSLIDPLAFDEVIVQSLFRSGVQAERVEGQAP